LQFELRTSDFDCGRLGAPNGVDPNGPPLFTALQDQLGPKVAERKAIVSVIVIDRIDPLIPD